jgi:hypothetical protein
MTKEDDKRAQNEGNVADRPKSGYCASNASRLLEEKSFGTPGSYTPLFSPFSQLTSTADGLGPEALPEIPPSDASNIDAPVLQALHLTPL